MFENLNVFSMASALAQHGAQRQSVVAENIANADTPGYRARDVRSFAESYAPAIGGAMKATRAGHMFEGETRARSEAREVYRPGAASPNGNTVSIENEIFAAAEASGDHRKALAVYRSALTVLRTAVSAR